MLFSVLFVTMVSEWSIGLGTEIGGKNTVTIRLHATQLQTLLTMACLQ